MLSPTPGRKSYPPPPGRQKSQGHSWVRQGRVPFWEGSRDRLTCGVFSVSCEGFVKSCNSKKISELSTILLDISTGGATIKYHLRSVSGSNGPEAKESSPLLGIGPI